MAQLDYARISWQARQINPRKVLVVIVVTPPYVFGWLIAKVFLVLWLILAHAGVAFSAGWKAALKGAGGPAR